MSKLFCQTFLFLLFWHLFGLTSSLCAQIKNQINQDVYLCLDELSADKINSKKIFEKTEESTLLPQESYRYFGWLQKSQEWVKPKKESPSCLGERSSLKVGKKSFLFLTSGTSPPTVHLN